MPPQGGQGRAVHRFIRQARQVHDEPLTKVFEDMKSPNAIALVGRIGQPMNQVKDVHGSGVG